MQRESEESMSLWMATAEVPPFKSLEKNISADVCIIGGGIAGMTTAYLLTKEGQSVVVLEDGMVCSGETKRSTAHLTDALDDRYFEIERIHGKENAVLAAQSHKAAIDLVDQLIKEERLDCGFERVDGYLFLAPKQKDQLLTKELDASHRAGLTDVERLDRVPFEVTDLGPCLRFPCQAQLHPVQYIAGLAQSIKARGGKIYINTHARRFQGGKTAKVETENGHVVSARHIVVATNTPVNDRVVIHTKQAAYRTYVIGVRIPKNTVPRALYWDMADPYHYIRIQSGVAADPSIGAGRDVLIVGGEDHKTGQDDHPGNRFDYLEAWTRQRFPMSEAVAYRWSGQVMEPNDGMAYIGRNPLDHDNVYIATGDSGNGTTHGTIAGILLTDMILGRRNPWQALYDPSRFKVRALSEFTRENLNVASQYTNWLTPGEKTARKRLPKKSGAVVRCGLHKVAVYCDASGAIHERSAVCRHLGAIVTWNPVENSWDCPAHGSRYTVDGVVVNGPADTHLPSHKKTKRTK